MPALSPAANVFLGNDMSRGGLAAGIRDAARSTRSCASGCT